jgi:hypothetical protein
LIDQRLVLAGVALAVPDDDPHVVGVVQHRVDAAVRQRPLRVAASAAAAQTLPLQMRRQLVERPLARGVQRERQLDQRRALLVHDHAADVLAADQLAL